MDTGTYNIRVRDGNGCAKKDAGMKEIIKLQTITQPSESLRIDFSQTTNPLAFGYSDGSVQAIIAGGTPDINGNYTAQWTDFQGNVLSNVTTTSSPYKTVLNNVKNGKYTLTVTDSNYPLAQGTSAASCIVTNTFNVVEPAPLIVNIEVSSVVLCHGDANGKLHANAKGGIEIPGRGTYTNGSKIMAGYGWISAKATALPPVY